MRHIILFILGFTLSSNFYAQELELKTDIFKAININLSEDLGYDINPNILTNKKDNTFHFEISFNHYPIDTKELNKKFFHNMSIIENTYQDSSGYLRGCGPLYDGITNQIESGDLMLSMTIDNFVNNVIFGGKGVFFRNK